jgi:uncharacterized protein (TIGR03083 family)
MPMNDDEIWEAVDRHRLRTAELLESLSEQEWRQPSLCERWTVRDVAAHLSMQQIGIGTAALMAIRHPGGTNRIIRESSRRRAKLPPERIIDEIRATVGARRPNIGLTCREALIDILVHSQDIAIPMGRRIDVEPAAAAEAASRVWSYASNSKARVFKGIPLDGLRFTATDIAWSVGDGRAIEGPIVAILLILTGRLAALPMLSGDGTAALARS